MARAEHLALDLFLHLQAQCLLLVVRFHHLLVVVSPLEAHAPVVLVVSVQALAVVQALVALAALVVLVVLALAVQVVLAVQVAQAVLVPEALVAHVLVLLLVLAPLALVVQALVLVAQVPVLLAAVLVLVAALVGHATVNVAHLERSRVLVAGASSMNCSRSSRATRIATHLFQKAQSSSSAVGQHKSSLPN